MYLHSLGHHFPEQVISNSFYNGLDIGSDGEWIAERTGIRNRRSVLKAEDIEDLRYGRKTREQLVQENRLPPIPELVAPSWGLCLERASSSQPLDGLDTVIGGTSIPDYDVPSSACAIAAKVGLSHCRAFDVSSACSTFIVQLMVAQGLILSGQTRKCGIFSGERYLTRQNFKDRATCILFGDGAYSAIVGSSPADGGFRVLRILVESDPTGWDLIKIPDGGAFFQQGSSVQKFAIQKTVATGLKIMSEFRLKPEDIHYFVGHQANLRMLHSAVEKLGFQESQHFFNVDQFGNQGGVGAPAVLSQNWDKCRSGDKVLMVVVGAGLTWGGALFEKL